MFTVVPFDFASASRQVDFRQEDAVQAESSADSPLPERGICSDSGHGNFKLSQP